jgi:hypothetical protein
VPSRDCLAVWRGAGTIRGSRPGTARAAAVAGRCGGFCTPNGLSAAAAADLGGLVTEGVAAERIVFTVTAAGMNPPTPSSPASVVGVEDLSRF